MRKALVAIVFVMLGGPALADGKMDWSSYLEPKGAKTPVASKPVDITRIDKDAKAKPAKKAAIATKAPAVKKPAGKP